MRFNFEAPEDEDTNCLAEVEMVFDDGEPLSGLKLVGFAVRRDSHGNQFVTMPSRAFGVGGKRQYFDFLRSARERHSDTTWIKRTIMEEWHKHLATCVSCQEAVKKAQASS